MKTVATLRLEGMLREPEAIDKNPGGSRIPKSLNLLHYFAIPLLGELIIAAQTIGSRKAWTNTQQYQAL